MFQLPYFTATYSIPLFFYHQFRMITKLIKLRFGFSKNPSAPVSRSRKGAHLNLVPIVIITITKWPQSKPKKGVPLLDNFQTSNYYYHMVGKLLYSIVP